MCVQSVGEGVEGMEAGILCSVFVLFFSERRMLQSRDSAFQWLGKVGGLGILEGASKI